MFGISDIKALLTGERNEEQQEQQEIRTRDKVIVEIANEEEE